MTIRGQVRNGVVLPDDATARPVGTPVEVTPLGPTRAAQSAPADAAPPYRPSNEQRDTLLRLIGFWKTDRPPNDDDVERIVDEYRTRKHG